MRLGDATWVDIEEVRATGDTDEGDDGTLAPVLLIPLGSTEQHGPHLPMSTDTLIAEEITGRAIHLTDGLIIGPTISVSASGEHTGFPGTLSIGNAAMSSVVVELVRSADWAAGIVFINGHGGNHAAVTRAVEVLSGEGRQALAWWPKWPQRQDGGPKDLHAGRIETSLMLAIDPGLVRLELAQAGSDGSIDELRANGVKATSPSGVLGDPNGASGSEGEQFIQTFVEDLIHNIERWRPINTTS
jgi:mycofactocin system creatininase family protein